MLFASLAALALAAVPGTLAATSNSTCVNPQVRKEWRSFSKPEKADFVRAVQCLSAMPHNPALYRTYNTSIRIPEIVQNSSHYDDFVYIHGDLNRTFRGTSLIFAWHRWFAYKFEKTLQDGCNYKGTLPYWDWTQDSHDLVHSAMWDDDAETGIGGWGDPNDNYVIKTGGFKDFVRAYPVQHKIRRQFLTHPFAQIPLPITPLWPDHNVLGNTTYSRAKVDWIMENCGPGDYFCFQSHGEGAQKIGGGFHVAVGGDLAGTCPIVDAGFGNCTYGAEYTSNDPTFFMHHGNLDRMWDTWQRKDPANAAAFYGGSVQTDDLVATYPLGLPPMHNLDSVLPSDGLFGPKEDTVGDVLSTTGGILCYVYDKPISTKVFKGI